MNLGMEQRKLKAGNIMVEAVDVNSKSILLGA